MPVPGRWHCMSLLVYLLRRVLSVPALAPLPVCVSVERVLATALVLCLFSLPVRACLAVPALAWCLCVSAECVFGHSSGTVPV